MLVTITIAAVQLGVVARAGPDDPPVRLPMAIEASHHTVVVVKGDHLWKISERHLDSLYEREVENSEISPYWRAVISVNLPTLRSGDPDLIYPGELITLPDTG